MISNTVILRLLTFFFLHSVFSVIFTGCTPPPAPEPGVKVGGERFIKSLVLTDKRVDIVTDIKNGEFDTHPGTEICIAGNRGALIVNGNYVPLSFIDFLKDTYPITDFEIVDFEKDGNCEFMTVASWLTDLAVRDHRGRLLWTYQAGVGGNDSCATDLNGDGTAEIVLVCNGDGGIHLLDKTGKRIWRKPGSNVGHVEAADVDGDGQLEIVTREGKIIFRDRNGRILKKINPAFRFSNFSLAHYPTNTDRVYMLVTLSNKQVLLDFDGKTVVAKFHAGWIDEAKGMPVCFSSNEPAYFAIIGSLPYQGELAFGLKAMYSVLYIFDFNGKLAYHEVFSENDSGSGICALPSVLPGEEVLLVGGNGNIYKYSLKAVIDKNPNKKGP